MSRTTFRFAPSIQLFIPLIHRSIEKAMPQRRGMANSCRSNCRALRPIFAPNQGTGTSRNAKGSTELAEPSSTGRSCESSILPVGGLWPQFGFKLSQDAEGVTFNLRGVVFGMIMQSWQITISHSSSHFRQQSSFPGLHSPSDRAKNFACRLLLIAHV